MDRGHFLIQILTVALLMLKCLKAQELAGNNLFSTSTTDTGAGNSNLQARLSAYYQSMQTLPFHATSTSPLNQPHPGYNYLTPASTYASFTTSKQSTQTAPLAVSVHPDDYAKFDKTEDTFFVPRPKSLSPKLNIKAQPNFFIPRNVHALRNRVQVQSHEAKPTNKAENLQTTTEAIQYQSDSDLRAQLQEGQQNWRPLLQQQNFESSSSPLTNQGASHQSTDFSQLNQGVSFNPSENATNFRSHCLSRDLPIDCQRHSSNLENRETELRAFYAKQSEGASQATLFPRQKTPLAVDTPSFISPTETPRNLPTSSTLNARNQQRLNLIKSLLSEYLALTQSYIPSVPQRAQVDLSNGATAERIADNRFSAEAQAFQYPAYASNGLGSPAANKFIDADQFQSQQFHQTRPTIPAVRQPHSVYGAPFVDSLNPVSDQSYREIS